MKDPHNSNCCVCDAGIPAVHKFLIKSRDDKMTYSLPKDSPLYMTMIKNLGGIPEFFTIHSSGTTGKELHFVRGINTVKVWVKL